MFLLDFQSYAEGMVFPHPLFSKLCANAEVIFGERQLQAVNPLWGWPD